jgi:hypothetical protein
MKTPCLLSIRQALSVPVMKSTFLFSLSLIFSLVFSSCYRIPDKPRQPRKQIQNASREPSISSETQQKLQEQRDKMKETESVVTEKKEVLEETKEKVEAAVEKPIEKPAAPKRKEYAFANPVPGKPGFVFSPYNNELVDVRDIPSGTLVQDPTYPAAEKKYFRVP